MKEARVSQLDEIQKHVIAFDEMCINEDLVYDKHTDKVIGFVNSWDVNNQLSALEVACNPGKQ